MVLILCFIKVEEYSGKRDLSVLKEFVEKHLAAKEEAKEDEEKVEKDEL